MAVEEPRWARITTKVVLSVAAAVATVLLALLLSVTIFNPGTRTGPAAVATDLWPVLLMASLAAIWHPDRIGAARGWLAWLIGAGLGVLAWRMSHQFILGVGVAWGVVNALHRQWNGNPFRRPLIP